MSISYFQMSRQMSRRAIVIIAQLSRQVQEINIMPIIVLILPASAINSKPYTEKVGKDSIV